MGSCNLCEAVLRSPFRSSRFFYQVQSHVSVVPVYMHLINMALFPLSAPVNQVHGWVIEPGRNRAFFSTPSTHHKKVKKSVSFWEGGLPLEITSLSHLYISCAAEGLWEFFSIYHLFAQTVNEGLETKGISAFIFSLPCRHGGCQERRKMKQGDGSVGKGAYCLTVRIQAWGHRFNPQNPCKGRKKCSTCTLHVHVHTVMTSTAF